MAAPREVDPALELETLLARGNSTRAAKGAIWSYADLPPIRVRQPERPAWNDVRRVLRSLPTLRQFSDGEFGATVRLTTLGDLTFVAVSAEPFAGGVVGFLATTLLPGQNCDRRRLFAYVAVPDGESVVITGRGLLPDPAGDDFRLPVYRCATELVGIG